MHSSGSTCTWTGVQDYVVDIGNSPTGFKVNKTVVTFELKPKAISPLSHVCLQIMTSMLC